jgi:hypothetical protein
MLSDFPSILSAAMTTSINLSLDKGRLISVYIEGEIQSVTTKSDAVGQMSTTTVDIAIARYDCAVKAPEENWSEEELIG